MLLTGDFESPLLTYSPYIEYMRTSCAPKDFVFDHAAADQHIQLLRDKGEHDLADTCEKLLDNPPHYDGFRPCNSAVFFAMVSSLKPDDMYVIRDILHGDGIRLRNKVWHAMTGDAGKSKKLMAMNMSKQVSDVKYRFIRHGVAKYFTEIAKTLSKLKSLGVEKQDWEIFSTIFHHMSEQCEEYRAVVSDLRDQLEKDEDSVTLKSIEKAFARKETVHKIGTSNKGTPLKQQIPMSEPPVIKAAAAKAGSDKPPTNPQQQATSKSKLWPEMTAESNYGARGSHSKGQCKYYGHRFNDDHCWEGCAKCGGCKEYHKRRRLMDEGKQLCTVHKYATHLEKNCFRHKRQARGRGRGRGRSRRHNSDNDRRSQYRKDTRDTRSYHAKSARKRSRSRSPSRSRDRSRSRSRSRRHRRHRSRSPHYPVAANYTAPKYLRDMQSFARGGRTHDHRRHDSAYPWSSGASRSRSSHHEPYNSNTSVSAHSAASSQYSSASAMQSQHARRRNMGHIPFQIDGTHRHELINLIMRRNDKRGNSNSLRHNNDRRVVASAAQNRSQSSERTTLIDSGAGLNVVDDESLYIPGSEKPFKGDVQWGDGSRKRIKYAGKAPAIGKMINTGGAASANLLAVGSTLDALSKTNDRDFVMAFDRHATYLMRDAKFTKATDGGYFFHHPPSSTAIMQTARRGPGHSGVYEAPLYDSQSTCAHRFQPTKTETTVQLAEIKALSSLPVHNYVPNWHCMPTDVPIFNADVTTLSANESLIARDIMRKHNAWGHPSPAVLREMLLQRGTQRSKRLARKVRELSQLCNGCLSGSSHKQPHPCDPEQPTSVAVRPMQHMMSDCMGKQDIDTPTPSGFTIVYVIACQFSKYLWLWLLKSTSDVTAVTEQFLRIVVRQKKRISAQNDTEILTWRSDNGPDNPKAFTDMLTTYGIDHQRTGSNASQQNGGAEIRIKGIEVKVRTFLHWAHAPRAWRGEAALYACTTTNHTCSLSNSDNLAPITLMYGRKPDYSKLHPFGCLAFIHIEKKNRHGVLAKATHHGALMGYATGSDGRIISYRIYNYDTNRFSYPYNVTFNDDIPAVPYIASLKQLAPAVRLKNRTVRKTFNGTDYMGKITHIRADPDGDIVYGVTYSDNDYEEYNFSEIMMILQSYNPADDIDNEVLEITPFFGSSKRHLTVSDKIVDPQPPAPTQPSRASKPSKPARRSTRVRVVRRPHNVGSKDLGEIPSSLNRHRLRYALTAQTATSSKFRRSPRAQPSNDPSSNPPSLKRAFRAAMIKRAEAFEAVLAHQVRVNRPTGALPEPIVIPPGTFVDTLPIPKSYDDAVLGPYRNYWIPAIASEIANLKSYGVWRLEQIPMDSIPVKGKLVFKWKPDSNNHLLKAKARFTMQGFRQTKNLHYKKTYAPVAYAQSVRVAVKLGVDLDYEIDVTDLESAYLTANIEPDISLFIEPPPGVDVPKGYGLRLVKALYGSMQGAQRLDVLKHSALEKLGFKRMASETSVYFMPITSELGLVIIVTIVDDFVIIAKDRAIMAEVKRRLATVWKITDQGPAKWVLNLRIRRNRPAGILKIDQQAYIEKKLREFGIDHLPGKKLPMKTNHNLSTGMCPKTPAEKEAAKKLPYRSRTGSLNYLRLTRPDMCCCNSILSQFNKNYGKQHFDATTHAWQYASLHKLWGLVMRKSGWCHGMLVNVGVYVDAGFASCPDTRRSRGGFFLKLNGDVVDFDCKLQPGVPAQSTAVAEYRAVTTACNAVIWLRSFLSELGISIREPILFHEDNEACINTSTNFMTTKRTKHVDVKHHVIRYWCKEDVIDFAYIESSSQLADIMTKCLPFPAFRRHRSQCMSNIHVDDVTGLFKP